MSSHVDAERKVRTSVYRIFDREGRLLYVGCAENVTNRIYMHLNTMTMADWGAIRFGYDRHEAVEYRTRLAARAAERKAIHDEAPWFNRQHNPKRWRRVNGKYQPVDAAALAEVEESIRLAIST